MLSYRVFKGLLDHVIQHLTFDRTVRKGAALRQLALRWPLALARLRFCFTFCCCHTPISPLVARSMTQYTANDSRE